MHEKRAKAEDAELILKLYDLRREPLMREARTFLVGEFWPVAADEVLALLRDVHSRQNGFFRQVVGYWEMAAAFVLRGALDEQLFLDANNENLFLVAKFHPLLPELEAEGRKLLPLTRQYIETFAPAKQRLEGMLKNFNVTRELYERRDAEGAKPA